MKKNSILLLAMLATMIGCFAAKRHEPNPCCVNPDGSPVVNSRAVVCADPLLDAASHVTAFEDEIRCDGSITIKTPDVWGDRNLMHWIQEFDTEIGGRVDDFAETIQGISTRSDSSKFVSSTEIGAGVEPANVANSSAIALASLGDAPEPFDSFSALLEKTTNEKIQLEPTERIRQHATYVYVNQALRRKNMGGDNTRQAGYGLYLFRIPVSILPGQSTSQGYAAVANLRARMVVTPADVKYTLPRMAVADLVETMAEYITKNWEAPPKRLKDEISEFRKRFNEFRINFGVPANGPSEIDIKLCKVELLLSELECDWLSSDSNAKIDQINALVMSLKTLIQKLPVQGNDNSVEKFAPVQEIPMFEMALTREPITPPLPVVTQEATNQSSATGVPQLARDAIGADEYIHCLQYVKKIYGQRLREMPSGHEVRHVLFDLFMQVANHLDSNNALVIQDHHAVFGDGLAIDHAARMIERGQSTSVIKNNWINEYKLLTAINTASQTEEDSYYAVAWLVAQQCGLLDLNLKGMLEEMALNNPEQDFSGLAESINFFNPADLHTATEIWQTVVDQEFPLQVFTLEPVVEEQNIVDAVSQIREMQLALAASVAQGTFNAAQKVAMARRLANEAATISLNRTVVGFAHGDDTFGWYFYPRFQPFELPESNCEAIKSTITGRSQANINTLNNPARRIEPGMRECEVLIAMPSFVSKVEFDVTTNWESLACPGKPKRSYQEMLAQSSRFQQIKTCLAENCHENGYRPGDSQRLSSRVEQLENLLGMQTHTVNVPFAYEQTFVDIFDTGDRHLVPEVHGYYGLNRLATNDLKDGDAKEVVAEFFITGRNFHPTQTHVIVGGHESHTIGMQSSATGTLPNATGTLPNVEVLSRQLIKVKVGLKENRLSVPSFEVRVGTPNGLSNPLNISKADAPTPTPKSQFDLAAPIVLTGYRKCCTADSVEFVIENPPKSFTVKPSAEIPFNWMQLGGKLEVAFSLKAAFDDKTSADWGSTDFIEIKPDNADCVFKLLRNAIKDKLKCTDPATGKITVQAFVRLDRLPLIKCDTPIIINMKPPTAPACKDCNDTSSPNGKLSVSEGNAPPVVLKATAVEFKSLPHYQP